MTKPDFSFEKKIWDKGFKTVIGVDEVGRGAFAGPVVAAACALRFDDKVKSSDFLSEIEKIGINDSKLLSCQKRKDIASKIKNFFYFGIGESAVGFINGAGIVPATERAMRQAVVRLMYRISVSGVDKNLAGKSYLTKEFIDKSKFYLLLDAFQVKYVPVVGLSHQFPILKGDQKSITIAAASIVAKVYRDNLMENLGKKYPNYNWKSNKGYGTNDHRTAIAKYGICSMHRSAFVKNWIKS